VEKAEFKSAVGSFHWLATQSRPDVNVYSNMLQKCQAGTLYADVREANRLTKEIAQTAEVEVRVLPMSGEFTVCLWSDSALYNAWAEPIEDDVALKNEREHKVFSQHGALVGLVETSDLESHEPVGVSIVDWKTAASRRVVHSTFAAETSALASGLGRARWVSALLAEMYHGGSEDFRAAEVSQKVVPIMCYTDCRSLYDHVMQKGKLPDDRHEALHIAELRQMLQAGPVADCDQRARLNWVPSRAMLADGLTKPGLSKQMRAVLGTAECRLHEVSEQSLLRSRKARKQ
jgi:hypothetical protein